MSTMTNEARRLLELTASLRRDETISQEERESLDSWILDKRDETYNGWTNYPTWAVNLWLSNDEGLYNATMQAVNDMLDPAQEGDSPDQAVYTVADYLKTWVSDELAPDLGATFGADLLGYALALVDWYEIAEAWIASVNEQ